MQRRPQSMVEPHQPLAHAKLLTLSLLSVVALNLLDFVVFLGTFEAIFLVSLTLSLVRIHSLEGLVHVYTDTFLN